MPWELRQMDFIATSTTHTLKFLPSDDDTLQKFFLNGGLNEALRMGIDNISLTSDFISIQEEKKDQLVSIYPNPTICNLSNEAVKIQVFNLIGEIVYKNEKLSNEILKLELHKSGIYIVKVESVDGDISRFRIIRE